MRRAGRPSIAGKSWRKPTSPLIQMTPEQADSVPPYLEIQRPMNFESGQIKATIDPQRLSVPNVLQRADIFVLKIIAESFKDRPIYFSRTSAGYGQRARAREATSSRRDSRPRCSYPPRSAAATRSWFRLGVDGPEAHENAVGQRVRRKRRRS